MIKLESSGSFDDTEQWLKKMADASIFQELSRYGQIGVQALTSATPKDTYETANSWYYEIVQNGSTWSIIWGNDKRVDNKPLAILLQYGHGTGTGGYVQGRDYINPALQPVFDQILADAWKVVTSA